MAEHRLNLVAKIRAILLEFFNNHRPDTRPPEQSEKLMPFLDDEQWAELRRRAAWNVNEGRADASSRVTCAAILAACQERDILKERDSENQNRIHVLRKIIAACQQDRAYQATHRISGKPFPDRPDLQAVFDKAKAALEAMTPEQREAHFEAQRRSWVKGEMDLLKANREEGRPE